MQQAQLQRESAFKHVVANHMFDDLIISDEELNMRLGVMEENIPAPRVVVGMLYPPTKRWSAEESCLDYLRAVVALQDHQYELECRSPIFREMAVLIDQQFGNMPNWAMFDHALETRDGAIKMLTFLTGEEYPPKPMNWEGVYWAVVDHPQTESDTPNWFIGTEPK